MSSGVDVRIDSCDIRGRWFGVVVGATPRLGELRRGETIPWRVIAAQIAPQDTAETLTILTPASPPRSGLYCRWRGSRARQQPGVRRACVRRDATEADVTSITMQFLC